MQGQSVSGTVKGTPFIRAYALDEIGKAPRSARLGFDSFGRFAVMYDGVYTVLNDTTWVDRVDPQASDRLLMQTIRVYQGVYYYGGRGSWGIAESTSDGLLRAKSLAPNDAPAWTAITPFNEILFTPSGVCFYEINGVVFWHRARRENHFFELPQVRACFLVGERIFVSCQDKLLREILPESGDIVEVHIPDLEGAIVERAVSLDSTRSLLALQDRRLVLFDGQKITPWPDASPLDFAGRVLALTTLPEGGTAISIAEKGIYLFSKDGSLIWRLPQSEFTRIDALASNEPGVVWAKGENAIYKIFYHSPLTNFGQSVGLNVSWPRLSLWNGRLLVCSARTLYEHLPSEQEGPSRFKPFSGLPAGQIGAMATSGAHLLVAAGDSLLSVDGKGRFEEFARLQNVSKITFIEPDLCVVLGSQEIASFIFTNGKWIERHPRIAGIGDGPVRTMLAKSLWIEMGGDKVAKLTVHAEGLRLERVPVPWSGGSWTNLGAIGSLIIFSGAKGNRAYYDENLGEFRESPRIDALLNRSPFWIARVTEGNDGVIWATHSRGVVKYIPKDGDFQIDATRFELRNDSYPEITVLSNKSVWVSCSRALYQIEDTPYTLAGEPHLKLVSIAPAVEGFSNPPTHPFEARPLRFSYDQQDLAFRFFSGSYAWQSPSLFEYRLNPSEQWMPIEANQVLRFPKIREGNYQLEVRPVGPTGSELKSINIAFSVAPPWYRTPFSYAAGAAALLVAVLIIARWINQRSIRRNVELEALVTKRTAELEATMERLNDETRTTATLAERSRLAAELHDSLQQGLSGTILHLETTLTHPSLTPEVKTHLGVMRRMLSYSREEVQQAVWNLESPLLQNSTIDQALLKLVDFIRAGSVKLIVEVPPTPVVLGAAVQHNLLRIAQEALTNAVKHAHATSVQVRLGAEENLATLTICDDGCGFDVTTCHFIEGHLGLRGMDARARSIGGELQIQSSPNSGTTVKVSVRISDTTS